MTLRKPSASRNGKRIRVFETRDPAQIDWSSTGAEVVVESTGRFTDRADAKTAAAQAIHSTCGHNIQAQVESRVSGMG